ncbi:MAG TPA: arginine--tRNA ligase [Candidatus Limnocylindrales bacterium]|nr:arginine--tRNA ligase [Candidatus Limnocylindrales bacterium]
MHRDDEEVEPGVVTEGPFVPVRTRVRAAVEAAWRTAEERGALPPIDPGGAVTAATPAVEVERPANPDHGDLASNLALKLARPLRRSPLQIATAIADALRDVDTTGDPKSAVIASVEVAPPGFLNLRLADAVLEDVIGAILAEPDGWGRVPAGTGRSVNVEFVSANPTGPLTIGNARGAFVGDLLCRVLEAGGQRVTREYYFNDAGGQIDKLGASVAASRRGDEIPEDGYHGEYVEDLARSVPDDVWRVATADGADPAAVLGHWAAGRVRAQIEASLARLGVRFDVWKSEGSLHDEGWVGRAVDRLRAGGYVYEQDGAVWFRSTAFGDDKDRVIIRSNGQPTYFASDIGYVTEKLSRGFDHLIYIWGADHHGTVARVQNAAEAMGYDRRAVEILLYAWVRFVRNGVEVSMSKRAGEFVTLDELLSEVGVDAARWFFASRAATTEIDFDIELAKKQSNENPVYYVQYAHARIASILRKAAEVGLAPAAGVGGFLRGAPEAALARAIVRLPEVVEDAVASEETHGITAYATELATQFHAFYRDARVVDPAEPELSAARLALVSAARITLANALGLLGISAPDAM